MNFYNYDRVISYNCPVNILIGERGVGKSYGAKEYVINRWLKKKEKFLYIRRYDNEIKAVFSKGFFLDIAPAFPELKLKSEKKKFYCGKDVIGYAKRLTEAQDLKSASFDDVTTIIFDEYAIEKNKRYYLPNEGMIIAGLLDSIIRNRSNVKIFFIMNAVQDIEFCPLFSFFGLTLPYNNDIKLFKNNLILVQYMKNEVFRAERKQTLIGQLMEDTPYFEYAIDNQIIGKNNDFIEKKSGSSRFVFAVVFKGSTYGIWNDYSKRKSLYISRLRKRNEIYICNFKRR